MKNKQTLNLYSLFKYNFCTFSHNFCKLKPEQSSVINTKEIRTSLNKIKSFEHNTITKPDKRSGIVILNRLFLVLKLIL